MVHRDMTETCTLWNAAKGVDNFSRTPRLSLARITTDMYPHQLYLLSDQEGLYFLIYHVCPYDPYILSSFELEFHFGNKDKNNHETYLSSGERVLPLLYLYFAISYLLCLGIWYSNIRLIQSGGAGYFVERGVSPNMWRPVVYPIHQLMTVLLILKFLSIAFESLRFHAINVSGQAVVWSIFYYTISFVKGIFLFCVILLIGTGWSIVKPFLNDREKKTMLAVLILQVASNIAILCLSTETEGQTSYHTWTFVLHAVDILCCCAVLIPIVWQVDQLEKNAGLDEIVEDSGVGEGGTDRMERDAMSNGNEKSDVLSKLKLFRTFYLLVIGYIYSTRILIYLFVSLLDFRHLWVRHFVVELITLAFYVSVGMLFRPVPEASSSYQRVALADGGREVELASATTHKNGTNRTTRV
jgi:G protein-coupled receptor 107